MKIAGIELGNAVIRSLSASVLLAAQVALASDLDRLDRLVTANDTLGVLRAFREPGWPEQQLLEWLTRRAEAGYVPAQYELALRRSGTVPTQALDWFARARMNRVLDESECRNKSRAGSVGVLLDLGYQSLDAVARANEPAFLASMERALKSESGSSRANPYWICEAGNADPTEAALLAPDERAAKRKAQLEYLARRKDQRALEARVNSRVNPTGFEFRLLSEALFTWEPVSPFLVWVANGRLLLTADRGEGIAIPTPRRLYLWDERTDELRVLGDNALDVCFNDGVLSYVTYRDGVKYYREGTLGQTSEQTATEQLFRYKCRATERTQPHRSGLVRLPFGGSIEADTKAQVYRFSPDDGRPAFDLPWTFHEIGALYPWPSSFSNYANSYVFVSTNRDLATGVRRVWLLSASGALKSYDIPRGMWAYGSIRVAPSAVGFLIGTPIDGLYLMSYGGDLVKLTTGRVNAIAVTPDGCRAAVSMNRSKSRGNQKLYVHVAELCG